jgi:hypothetical protein
MKKLVLAMIMTVAGSAALAGSTIDCRGAISSKFAVRLEVISNDTVKLSVIEGDREQNNYQTKKGDVATLVLDADRSQSEEYILASDAGNGQRAFDLKIAKADFNKNSFNAKLAVGSSTSFNRNMLQSRDMNCVKQK